MKIFICCSKHNYFKIPEIKMQLEKIGHIITLPNSFDNPMREEEARKLGQNEHSKWKSQMLKLQEKKVIENDAVVILNFEKNGQPNYIGGATFLEMFKAWELNKKIFMMNPIPKGILEDEIIGFNPTILNGDLTKIK